MIEKLFLVITAIFSCGFTMFAYFTAEYVFETGYPTLGNLGLIFILGCVVGLSLTLIIMNVIKEEA
jgi:hypothetical protein